MRVCYFTNVYPAPSHTTMRREIHALEALGVEVIRVAARAFDGPLVEPSDRAEALKTVYLTRSVFYAGICLAYAAIARPIKLLNAIHDAWKVGRSSKRGISKHLMYLGQACVLWRTASDCTHIHANFSNATSIATLCRVLGGPPISLRIHGPEEYSDFSVIEWTWRFEHASFIAPISEYGAQCIRALIPTEAHHKICLLRCGVDKDLLTSTETDCHSLPTQFGLVCVARLEPRKGHEVLLEAIAALIEDGMHLSLLVVGDGTCRTALEQRAKCLHLENVVTFLGWQSSLDVIDAVCRSRIVVLPSYAEGLPIVLMEAYALCRTVVTTNVDGNPELVIDGKTGWLVAPRDPEALARAIKAALLTSNEMLMAMATAGRSLVKEHHDAAKLMQDLYSRISGVDPSSISIHEESQGEHLDTNSLSNHAFPDN